MKSKLRQPGNALDLQLSLALLCIWQLTVFCVSKCCNYFRPHSRISHGQRLLKWEQLTRLLGNSMIVVFYKKSFLLMIIGNVGILLSPWCCPIQRCSTHEHFGHFGRLVMCSLTSQAGWINAVMLQMACNERNWLEIFSNSNNASQGFMLDAWSPADALVACADNIWCWCRWYLVLPGNCRRPCP